MICDRCGKQKNIRFRVSKYEAALHPARIKNAVGSLAIASCPLASAPDCTGNGPKNTHRGR